MVCTLKFAKNSAWWGAETDDGPDRLLGQESNASLRKTNKSGSPKSKEFRRRFGYFLDEEKVTRSGERNIPKSKIKA